MSIAKLVVVMKRQSGPWFRPLPARIAPREAPRPEPVQPHIPHASEASPSPRQGRKGAPSPPVSPGAGKRPRPAPGQSPASLTAHRYSISRNTLRPLAARAAKRRAKAEREPSRAAGEGSARRVAATAASAPRGRDLEAAGVGAGGRHLIGVRDRDIVFRAAAAAPPAYVDGDGGDRRAGEGKAGTALARPPPSDCDPMPAAWSP